jgi:hypothetical protein
MEEHTLGPWSVDGSATTDFDVVCADGRIAMVNGEDWSADMAEANAYLLAAAPELLGAVQLALRALNVAPRFKVPGAGDSYEVCSELERVLRKVEGTL